MSKENGGSAFPHEFGGTYQNLKREGMTLRDYFAAKAMQGMLGGGYATWQDIATDAYAMADAMLLERSE